jgi:hypothetical protein
MSQLQNVYQIHPVQVSIYLSSTGWFRAGKISQDRQTWMFLDCLQDDDPEDGYLLLVPVNSQSDGYRSAIDEAINVLAQVEKRSRDAIIGAILSIS